MWIDVSVVHTSIIFFIESSIYCQIDSSQCLAHLTPARVGIARSVHVQLGASTHVIRWDIVCLSPQSHTSVWDSFHIFIMARQRPFCTLRRFRLLQVDQDSSVSLAKCSFGIIPLSCHSVDRSPRAFHSSTHNVVRASCFEVVSASVESRKLFLDVSLCLAGRWSLSRCLGSSSWRQRYALLATFRRMWGGAIPASAYNKFCMVYFKQPVISLHVSFRAISTCPVCLERPPGRAGKFSCRKAKRQLGFSYGSWMSSPPGVC